MQLVGFLGRSRFLGCHTILERLSFVKLFQHSKRGMKVYTKTGDKGTSQLYSGERRAKDDLVFMALGDTDELNSIVGVAAEHCRKSANGLAVQLEDIQSRLFDVGSAIATPKSSASELKLKRTEFEAENVTKLEKWIDAMDEQLPPLKNFILPSGGFSSVYLHNARSVCRRAERQVVGLIESEEVDRVVGIYMNRLSDYFFVAARFAAMKEGCEEKIWKKFHSSQDKNAE